MKRIAIFGASNCGNVGDDLIALIIKEMLLRQLPDVEVIIADQGDRDLIERSDIVIVGGGGLIYDYDFDNVINYTNIINRAYEAEIPVFMMGMGVQHVFSDKAKEAYRNSLAHVKATTTRGDLDTEFLIKELGCDAERIITSRDVVFAADEYVEPVAEVSTPTSDKPVLLLSLADWNLGERAYNTISKDLAAQQKAYNEYIIEHAASLADDYTVRVVCQAREDIQLSEKLAKLTKSKVIHLPTIEDSTRLMQEYQLADIVVTGRYHGLIAALATQKPVIGVAFSGHKQKKLIDDTFPSLSEQFYTVKSFVEHDMFARLCSKTFVNTLVSASDSELDNCKKLVHRNTTLIKIIAGELAKR